MASLTHCVAACFLCILSLLLHVHVLVVNAQTPCDRLTLAVLQRTRNYLHGRCHDSMGNAIDQPTILLNATTTVLPATCFNVTNRNETGEVDIFFNENCEGTCRIYNTFYRIHCRGMLSSQLVSATTDACSWQLLVDTY